MEYSCNICNKKYASYQSLWIHNKKFHLSSNNHIYSHDSHSDNHFDDNKNIKKEYRCKKCNKNFSCNQNKWRHEKSCNKTNEQDEKESMKQKIKELEERLEYIEKTKHTTTKIINNINGNLISGNKITIHKSGTENMNQLTYEDVSTIFDNEISSVIKLVELVNFNDGLPQNHSIYNTSIDSTYVSFYNSNTNKINKGRKKYFFEEIICKSITNHEILYGKYKNKFGLEKRTKIENNIANLKKIRDKGFNNNTMREMISSLNTLSYNNRDIIEKTWIENGIIEKIGKNKKQFTVEIEYTTENNNNENNVIDKEQETILLKQNEDSDSSISSDSDSDCERYVLKSTKTIKQKQLEFDI